MIGIDLIKIERMERFMERFGEKALLRFLSPAELPLVKSPKNAAGLWAAKEACSKALGTGIGEALSFHDILVSKNRAGAPQITLVPEKLQQFDLQSLALSITHDGDYAIAVVAIEPRR